MTSLTALLPTSPRVSLLLGALLLFAPFAAGAQDAPPQTPSAEDIAMAQALQKAMTPGPAHARLAKQAGRWKMTTTFWPEPGGEPMVTQGVSERTMTLGGRVLEERVTATIGGMPFEGFGRTGYDNVAGEYWTTWSDNMSTGLLLMHGSYDDQGVAVFEGETLDPMSKQPKKVRMVIRNEGPDKELDEYHELSPEGLMVKTMEIVYERQ